MVNKTQEALKMAIEALELANGAETVEGIFLDNSYEINACKAALEQPSMTYEQGFSHGYEAHKAETALDRMAENARELGLEWESEQENCVHIGMGKCNFKGVCKHCKKQEPVAWMNDIAFSQDKELLGTQSRVVPLYTRPTRRLSDDEIEKIFDNLPNEAVGQSFIHTFSRAIENKLLEINNGNNT